MTLPTAAATANIVNGVDVNALFHTIDAIKGQPVIATFKFSNRNQWLDGGLNRSEMTKFYGACQEHVHKRPFVLDNDEPPVLLGGDTAPNPVRVAVKITVGSASSRFLSMGVPRYRHGRWGDEKRVAMERIFQGWPGKWNISFPITPHGIRQSYYKTLY